MPKKWLSLLLAILAGIFLNGCSGGRQPIPATPEMETHAHETVQTRTFGDRHYHAAMFYDSRAGIISIEFSDEYEYPLKILRAERVRAILLNGDDQNYEFYFHNPMHERYHIGSYRVAGERYPPTNNIRAQRDWLKNLRKFTLKVWVPLHGETYLVEFVYPQ